MRLIPLIIAAVSASTLQAQTLQEIADGLSMPERIEAGTTELPMPAVEGVTIKLLGADYEEIVNAEGKIAPVLSDTPVNVSFELSRGEESAISKDYPLTIAGPAVEEGTNPKPSLIPALLQWKGAKGICKAKEATVTINPELAATLGNEGYHLEISPQGITISAATSTGSSWGMESIKQLRRIYGEEIPCGEALDFPRYPVRGFLLDVGRVPIPMNYLYQVVDEMARFKMNDFQIHLNDNYIFHEQYVDRGQDPFKESYAGFRLESSIVGADGTPLTSTDLSYSKEEFRQLIEYARNKGVKVTPEIDTPGHALSLTRVRPDLIYQGPMGGKEKRRCEMLDAANPETLKFAAQVFDEYLLPASEGATPTFEGCTVHVGSDEFYGDAEDYRAYTDGLLKFILSRGYTPRVWGSLKIKPGKTPVQAKGVQLNLWSAQWASAWESINAGYDVINTNDGALYIVPFANYYRMDKNHKGLYENWLPNVIANETVPAGHPQLLGSMFAVWNDETDLRHPGYHPLDLMPMIEGSIDVLGQKMWGTATAPMSFEEHRELTKKFRETANMDYHLTAELEITEAKDGEEQALLQEGRAAFLPVTKDGRIGFRRDDGLEFAYNCKLPIGERVKVELIGTLGKTQLLVNGEDKGEPTLQTFKSEHPEKLSTFPLPEGKGSIQGNIFNINIQ